MDLSRLKWPLILLVIGGLIYLVTDPGVKFLRAKFNEGTPGQDAKQDEYNEAGLSNLAGFLIKTFRYASAEECLKDAIERYPEGKNFLNNKYRLAKCREKQGDYEGCIEILAELRDMDAHQVDERIPEVDVLNLRIDKLAETHDLGEVGQR